MTDKIDWQSQPEATHYDGLDFLKEGFFWDDGSGWIDSNKSIPVDAIPRPAQYRNWQDPAMWFDAPEWAASVIKCEATGTYYYSKRTLRGCRLMEVGSDKEIGVKDLTNGPVIAIRPTPKEPIPTVGPEPDENWKQADSDANWHPGSYTKGERAIDCGILYECTAHPSTDDQPSVGAQKQPPTWVSVNDNDPIDRLIAEADKIHHQAAITQLRNQAEALNKAADYLESLQ